MSISYQEKMTKVILYYRRSDFEINKVINSIEEICKKCSVNFLPVNIDNISSDPQNIKRSTPNLVVGPYNLNYPFSLKDAEIAIAAASRFPEKTKKNNLKKAMKKNKFGLFLAKFYPTIIGLLIMMFVFGAFAAPIFYSQSKTNSAKIIYGFYRIFCHQLAFRSIFINGEQLYYPRALAKIDNLITYEQEFNDPSDDINIARNISGNAQSGFKVALCQRDLAIYTSLALISFIFQISKKRIRPMKWYLWVIIGLIPIAIDGFSQIPGLSYGWPVWFPIRESTPFLRFFTGMLFGGMTGLYMYPLMEESMSETTTQLLLQREVIIASEKLIRSNEEN